MKRLRDEGRDGDAAEVKKLRRPTVAAWALDQLSVDASNTIGELLDAGAELARAQRATLSGRDPHALRNATTTRRELVARLTELAVKVLRDADRSPDAHVEDIRGTLEAASVDEAVAERLRAGTLGQDRRSRRRGSANVTGLQLVSRSDDEPEEAVTSGGSLPLPGREARLRRIVSRQLDADIRRLRRERDAAERKAAAAEEARARLAEQVASMQTRLDAAREKLRIAESSGDRAADEREARGEGVRRGRAQTEGERRLVLELDGVADADATGALNLRVHAERDPRLIRHQGPVGHDGLQRLEVLQPCVRVQGGHDAAGHLPMDPEQRLADADPASGPRVLLVRFASVELERHPEPSGVEVAVRPPCSASAATEAFDTMVRWYTSIPSPG